jgi:peptidyl-prolyl cis-trans isomerase A (cyclophilin A)
MRLRLIVLGVLFSLAVDAAPLQLRMLTNLGELRLELYPEQAPKTVANFLRYVRDGSYNHSLFHRLIPGFVVQGGGYGTDAYQRLPSYAAIANESDNGLSNRRYTLAMARSADPDSATRQFFINLQDNPALDYQPARWGYTVFGKIVAGEQVLQKMANRDTSFNRVLKAPDVPVDPIILEMVELIATPPGE